MYSHIQHTLFFLRTMLINFSSFILLTYTDCNGMINNIIIIIVAMIIILLCKIMVEFLLHRKNYSSVVVYTQCIIKKVPC